MVCVGQTFMVELGVVVQVYLDGSPKVGGRKALPRFTYDHLLYVQIA